MKPLTAWDGHEDEEKFFFVSIPKKLQEVHFHEFTMASKIRNNVAEHE